MRILPGRPRALALLSLVALAMLAGAAPAANKPAGIVGAWDLTVTAADGAYPSWLEVRKSGTNTLVGQFVGHFGSARPVSRVEFKDGRLRFTVPPQWEKQTDDLVFEGRLDGDTLQGQTRDEQGRPATWTGRRAPLLRPKGTPAWGEPIELFDGKTLVGWKARHADQPHGWVVRDGLLVNAKPGNDLVTDKTFGDFRLHAEFRYPPRSNSGIYLRGRYEVQIEDAPGDVPDAHGIGGVYGFLTPSVKAAKKPGEWQTMDITLAGRVLTIVFNGERVIDRQAIPGITGGALDSREGEPGPIMLQGDHGPIEFRKLTLTPAAAPSTSSPER